MKKQKENSHEGITWSEMGKQNVQAEKVYCLIIITMVIERFSNDCRKTKTKVITPANHNRSRQRNEPITIPSNYL